MRHVLSRNVRHPHNLVALCKTIASSSLVLGLAACGGGGSGGNSAAVNTASITTYNFATPQVNSQRTYTKTIIDNSNNTVIETIQDTITTVNPDLSFVVSESDPSNNTYIVGGTNYSVPHGTITRNNSGQEISASLSVSGGSATTCTFSPHGTGPNYPVSVGQTWSISFTETCGAAAPISFIQTGSVVNVEQVIVPAGTFTALKLQSTLSWTDSNGTTHTESITNWRDVNNGFSVKQNISFSYGGTAQINGHPVTTSIVLQSL